MKKIQSSEIIEQGMIKSAGDISRLGIVNWSAMNGYWQNDITRPIQIITDCLGNNAYYHVAA